MNYYLIEFKGVDPDWFLRPYTKLVRADSFEEAVEKLKEIWFKGVIDVKNKTIE